MAVRDERSHAARFRERQRLAGMNISTMAGTFSGVPFVPDDPCPLINFGAAQSLPVSVSVVGWTGQIDWTVSQPNATTVAWDVSAIPAGGRQTVDGSASIVLELTFSRAGVLQLQFNSNWFTHGVAIAFGPDTDPPCAFWCGNFVAAGVSSGAVSYPVAVAAPGTTMKFNAFFPAGTAGAGRLLTITFTPSQ